MKTHVALGKQMLPRSEYFLECLLPSPHRLPIYHYNDMSNNRRPYPFVGKGIVNVGCIAAVGFENGQQRRAPLLAAQGSRGSENTDRQEPNEHCDDCFVSARAARQLLLRHGADHIASEIGVNRPKSGSRAIQEQE